MPAPKVTYEQVQAAIKREQYRVLDDGRTTFCQLTLDNGFTVTATSSSACAENFVEQTGRELSRRAAEDKVWELLAFRLRDQLMFAPAFIVKPDEITQLIDTAPAQLAPRAANPTCEGWLNRLLREGGSIVRGVDCNEQQFANADKRKAIFAVSDFDGKGNTGILLHMEATKIETAAVQLLRAVGAGGGRLVCTGVLDNGQITAAHTMPSFFVDEETALGYVVWPWDLTTSKDHEREARLRAARDGRAQTSKALHAAKREGN